MRYTSIILAIIVVACGTEKKPKLTTEKEPKPIKKVSEVPKFNQDSAYHFVKQQVAFGPRVPNTPEHKLCAKYLEQKLKSYCDEILVQTGKVKAYTNEVYNIYNVMGRINPNASKRIVLFAHWDSRHIADRDDKNINQAILGANDGASGVGVLIEVARAISLATKKPEIGIDFVLFDAEDQGQPNEIQSGEPKEDTWCLGAQYWSKNIPFENYNPKFGVLLDMVGAADAVFPKEGVSMYYAPQVVEKVWSLARKLGYGSYFLDQSHRGGITDDHKYVNEIAGIKTIDIIHYNVGQSDFGSFHHTHNDNLDIIHKPTLNVVGTLVLELIYRER